MDESWVDLCAFEDLFADRGHRLEARGLRLAVFRRGDQAVVLSDRCPHAGGSLGSGWIEDDLVVCPLHRWRFRPDSGRCADVRGVSVATFATRVQDGRVWARLGLP